MRHELERNGSQLVVRLEGKLDAKTSPALQDDMAEAFDGVSSVLFDLEKLEYISSAGLRVLLASYKLMMKRDGTMQVINPNENVMSILTASGFAALFEVDTNEVG